MYLPYAVHELSMRLIRLMSMTLLSSRQFRCSPNVHLFYLFPLYLLVLSRKMAPIITQHILASTRLTTADGGAAAVVLSSDYSMQ